MLRITNVVMLVYCCLKWIYLRGGARACRRCKSLQGGQHESEHGGCLPPGQGVPASPGVFMAGLPVGLYTAHPDSAAWQQAWPSLLCLALLPAETRIKW